MISIFWVLVEKGITSLKLKGGSTLYAVLSKLGHLVSHIIGTQMNLLPKHSSLLDVRLFTKCWKSVCKQTLKINFPKTFQPPPPPLGLTNQLIQSPWQRADVYLERIPNQRFSITSANKMNLFWKLAEPPGQPGTAWRQLYSFPGQSECSLPAVTRAASTLSSPQTEFPRARHSPARPSTL